ncbi:MAG: hypothetical protein ACLSHF_02425 [[Eubacterium] siraeum]
MEKIKNLPVMRFVAFALAVAIILGLSSAMLSFTASAETADGTVSQLGTLGNYDCIKFKYNSAVSVRTVVDKFNSYGTGKYVYGAVFGYKDGSFVQYTNNAINYCVGEDRITFNNTTFYPSWLDKDTYSNSEFIFTESTNGKACSTYRYSTEDGYKYGSMTACAGNLSLSEFINTYGDTFYAVFTSSSSVWTTQQINAFKSDVINNCKDTDFNDPSITLPSAEFVTCASYTSDDNSIPLWFKDFTSEGQQYPLFTYYIHDNGNKHSYSLKLSYSSSAKDDVKKVFNLRENTKEDTDSTIKDVVERIVAMYAIHGVKMHDLTPYLRTALNLKFPNNLTYNQAFVLSSPEMDFSATGNNKVYTICLSDYSDIIQCLIYKVEIIDNNTGLVLDTTYFTSKQTFNKGNSGFGSKVYDYDNRYDDMINDIKNNTPSVEPDNKGNFGVDGDIIQTGRYDYYTGLKIDDIFGSLESSASSLGSFFQACMNIIPAGILAVIIGGLSIVIVLRILGR